MAKNHWHFQIKAWGCALVVVLLLNEHTFAQEPNCGNTSYWVSDSIAAAYRGENLRNLPLLAYNLTAPLSSDVAKYRSIYRWVFDNIDYDHQGFIRNRKMRKKYADNQEALDAWNAEFRMVVFDRLLKKQRTVCTGYAYLISELANMAGIECKIIDGYGRTVNTNVQDGPILNHSWNAVKLDGKWYLSDPTWANIGIENSDGRLAKTYNDGYFLPESELFLKNHYPLDTSWIMTPVQPTISEFLNAPLLYSGAFNHKVTPIQPSTMLNKVRKSEPWVVELKTQNKTKIDSLTFQILHGRAIDTVTPTISETLKGTYELVHTFRSTGKYDVHLMLGEDYLVTYTVIVKN